jgi:hypothetical protein
MGDVDENIIQAPKRSLAPPSQGTIERSQKNQKTFNPPLTSSANIQRESSVGPPMRSSLQLTEHRSLLK